MFRKGRLFSSAASSKCETMREFIFDSLYNKQHGYFSKNVNIFHSPHPIPFAKLRDQDDYGRVLKDLYSSLDQREMDARGPKRFNQLWHTPSELFKPFYGRAIANFILNHKTSPLVIYEIGPGNGTMAENILDFLRENYPKVYEQTEYNLIEISSQLKQKQVQKLERHSTKVKFPEIQILNLQDFREERPCWILAMEVLDNLAHDLIKFRTEDGALLEAIVRENKEAKYGSIPGKYWQEFREAEDPFIIEYVRLGDELGWRWASLKGKPLLRALERFNLFDYINPWSCEFIPTDSFKLLKNLTRTFPRHSVLFSDFDELPDTVKGHNGPVVQTRFRGVTVPCSSVLLERGLFDIFFPTNFTRLAQIHQKLRPGAAQSIQKHSQFIKKWSNAEDLLRTTTKSGYNPMIQDFENVSFYSCVHK